MTSEGTEVHNTRPKVNRMLFQQYPMAIRQRYAAVIQDHESGSRHSKLLKLGEETLAFLASVALSDYRNRRHLDPDPRVEGQLAELKRMSLGHYLQIFRMTTEAMQPALFDYKSRAETEGALPIGRFLSAYDAVEDAIALEAQNLRRLIAQRIANPSKGSWLAFWERFIEYRNRSEGHSSTYNWPVNHPDYYTLLSPLLEDALIEAITATHVQRVFDDHPIAEITNIRYEAPNYIHDVIGDDLGLPFSATIALDRSATDIWSKEAWQIAIGGQLMLTKLPSGGYEISGPYRDLAKYGPPKPLAESQSPAPKIIAANRSSTTPWHVVSGIAVGTCGELLQGFTTGGHPFHVRCPIQKTATVQLRVRRSPEFVVSQIDPSLHKLERSLYEASRLLKLGPLDIRVEHWSDLDVGKGMGSSTADIVAGARALAAVAESEFSPAELARIATTIESSDGSMYPGIVAFNQKTGDILREYSWWPQFIVCMIVPAQVFNTESAAFAGKERLGEEFDQLLLALDEAAATRQPAEFAAVATRSAELNQRFVPNPLFALLADRAEDLGALGLNVGHTGTVLGLLFDVDDHQAMRHAAAASVELQRILPASARIEITMTAMTPE